MKYLDNKIQFLIPSAHQSTKGITTMKPHSERGLRECSGNRNYSVSSSRVASCKLLVIDTPVNGKIIKMLIKSNTRPSKANFPLRWGEITMKVSVGDTSQHFSELLEFHFNNEFAIESSSSWLCYERI